MAFEWRLGCERAAYVSVLLFSHTLWYPHIAYLIHAIFFFAPSLRELFTSALKIWDRDTALRTYNIQHISLPKPPCCSVTLPGP